jgi:hypothetical protein
MKKKVIVSLTVAALLIGGGMFFMSAMNRPVSPYPTATKLPTGIDIEYVKKLDSLGFKNNESVMLLKSIEARKYWSDTYGVTYINDNDMAKFLRDNNFIMGDADRFKEEIPTDAGAKIIEGYKKLKGKAMVHTYRSVLNNQSFLLSDEDLQDPYRNMTGEFKCDKLDYNEVANQVIMPETISRLGIRPDFGWFIRFGESKIKIIAAKSKFNTEGMEIEDGFLRWPAPPDPIAVLQVPNGYVELANW